MIKYQKFSMPTFLWKISGFLLSMLQWDFCSLLNSVSLSLCQKEGYLCNLSPYHSTLETIFCIFLSYFPFFPQKLEPKHLRSSFLQLQVLFLQCSHQHQNNPLSSLLSSSEPAGYQLQLSHFLWGLIFNSASFYITTKVTRFSDDLQRLSSF